MNFTHLHVHSHYSLLDGLAQIDALIGRAKELGMDSLAITDHGYLYGLVEFYKKARKAGIKPILGCEMYLARGSRLEKNPGVDDKRYHITILASSEEGYKNLIKLATSASLEGYYYKPRIDKEILRQYARGLIALSGCLNGEIPKAISFKKMDLAESLVREYQDIFGKENFYLEIMPHFNLPDQIKVNEGMKTLSALTGAKLVATNDIHYVYPEDADAQDVLVSVQTGTHIKDEDRLSMKNANLSMRSAQEMSELFPDCPEAIETTQEIGEKIKVELSLGAWTFPNIEPPQGSSHNEELRRLTYRGIAKLGLSESEELKRRIEYELKVIRDKGFSPYFLVVADLLNYAHERGILTTVRGSVAGSMVTYLTGITNVNPFEYNLPFERFLNPERPSAPDIDMDFADNRRDEMIQYAKDKYGQDKVAQIGTFGTMMARAAVRDVARAMGYSYQEGDHIAKLIPMGSQGFPMTINKALDITPELRKIYESEEITKKIIDTAKKLEGCARHISVHAAGVVISPKTLSDYVPTQLDPRGGKIITQYDMHAIEDAGLLKFDFLGIRNLSILGDAVNLVKKFRGIDIAIEKIPLDDRETFQMLARGDTVGTFQLNGSGMTRYLKELRPSSIDDINAMVALYRPGPIESIPMYIQRKNNPFLVKYLDQRMKEILDKSYGIIVYQDDVMLIAIKLAGYTWLEADKLRKAMGKKIPAEMQSQKDKLIKGFIENGLNRDKALELWRLIEPFAAYGFNKAHAASYGRVAYQTSYMKAHFPGEYMTAVLTAESGDMEKIAEIIRECIRLEIPVLPPDINESFGKFTLIKGELRDKIRFGLESVKNVGSNVIEAIIKERGENGKFATLEDFLERTRHKDLNKKSLESLAKCGALDILAERNQILENLDTLLEFTRQSQKLLANGQGNLFGSAQTASPHLKLKACEPATKRNRLDWERELLGLYVTEHPIEDYQERLQKAKVFPLRKISSKMQGQMVTIGGIINTVQRINTKSGEPMLFVKMEDVSGGTEVLVFPKLLAKNSSVWAESKVLLIRGRVSDKDGSPKILCEEAKEII